VTRDIAEKRRPRWGVAIAWGVSIGLCAVPGCSSNGSSASSGPIGINHFQAALAGMPDTDIEQATAILAPILDEADWFYLSNATWPNDPVLALADPRLQKAMTPFLGTGAALQRFPVAVLALGAGSKLQPSLHLEDAPQIQGLYQQALQAMLQANGQSIAGTPPAVSGFAQLLGSAQKTLPSAGPPADLTTDTQTVEFFKGGTSVTTSTSTPLCCRSSLVFPKDGGASIYTCFDATSCKGKGEPPPGGLTIGSSAVTGDGGACAQGWSTACCASSQWSAQATAGQAMGLTLVCTTDNACYHYVDTCCPGQYGWVCLGTPTTLIPSCAPADTSCTMGQDVECCPFVSYP
jgi:hypothetical protein